MTFSFEIEQFIGEQGIEVREQRTGGRDEKTDRIWTARNHKRLYSAQHVLSFDFYANI